MNCPKCNRCFEVEDFIEVEDDIMICETCYISQHYEPNVLTIKPVLPIIGYTWYNNEDEFTTLTTHKDCIKFNFDDGYVNNYFNPIESFSEEFSIKWEDETVSIFKFENYPEYKLQEYVNDKIVKVWKPYKDINGMWKPYIETDKM